MAVFSSKDIPWRSRRLMLAPASVNTPNAGSFEHPISCNGVPQEGHRGLGRIPYSSVVERSPPIVVSSVDVRTRLFDHKVNEVCRISKSIDHEAQHVIHLFHRVDVSDGASR